MTSLPIQVTLSLFSFQLTQDNWLDQSALGFGKETKRGDYMQDNGCAYACALHKVQIKDSPCHTID